ncbi:MULTISPECIES: FecCD family ABC transporter permease [Actinomadura]|uniref:FecCD family ABC transporter permease n=1 Tax=Actinomadura yumaensis TaxID=111807 RepID=A0ABW2CNJ2_9ACTN|nr:iron chelate uptake ABC transporter family permease subunit [Actinomadura sp. J1-007]MWK36866.1 iron chelate uptake ABC transporter family permease subunit [Actinomadura sp. J1-007]
MSAKRTDHRTLWLAAAAAAVLLAAASSVAVGAQDLPITDLWHGLWARDGSHEARLVWGSRVPRTVLGLIVGACLGLSGALIQGYTRNPLADPGLIGVNAGAGLAVALAAGTLGVTTVTGQVWFAMGGALVAAVAGYLAGSAGARGPSPLRLTLAGLALGALLTGITSGLALLDPRAFEQGRAWSAGSLTGRDLGTAWTLLPFLAAGLVLALACARALNAVALGEETATALGLGVNRLRATLVAAVALLAGTATAAAGPIGFVGLMVPHAARWAVGNDQRWVLACTLLLAPALLLSADVAARVLLSPDELPVGVVTAFLGGPALLAVVRTRRLGGS